MHVVFEHAIGREATARLEEIVSRSLEGRRLPAGVHVYISRPRSGWSVFVSGLEEHPLHVAEEIRAALLREAPEAFVRYPVLRPLGER